MSNVQGIEKVKEALKRYGQRKIVQFTAGLTRAGLKVQRAAQEIVPVDYGPLKASAETRAFNPNTPDVFVIVAFGSEEASYAVIVHENPNLRHGTVFNAYYAAELSHAATLRKKRLGGTTGPFRHYRGANQVYKFLESPFRRMQAEIIATVAAELRK